MYAPSQPSSTPSRASQGNAHGYSKVRDIGQGSYGKATLVQDQEGRLYVMKTIDMSNMDKKQRRDAINEVRVLSFLKHPYIVSYRESFSESSTLAIIMDYADGGDLYQRISNTRKAGHALGEKQILRWFTEAALALKYMHDKHVLHRDLKTQNLFLTSSDRLRVGDFGISKVLENTAAFARTAIGTPYYLSPEICQEKPYSFGSDVWALGCVLYEMAALKVPFDAANLQALVQKIVRGPMPQVPATYTAELRQLCWDLLHRDQSQRPSATDIIQRRYVQDEIRRMLYEERAKVGPVQGVAPSPSQPPRSQHSPGPGGPAHNRPHNDGHGAAVSASPSQAQRYSERKPSSYRGVHSPARVYGQAAPVGPAAGQYPSRAPSPGSHRRYGP